MRAGLRRPRARAPGAAAPARLCTAPPPAAQWLAAAATHRGLGMSYDEACETVQALPPALLAQFEADLAAAGQQLVASTRELTVLDTEAPAPGTWLRSLHFNARLDYVQSCVLVRGGGGDCPADRVPDHSSAPPSTGATATHLRRLLNAVGLQRLLLPAGDPDPAPLRIVVLGAGGCTVPAHLATALRHPAAVEAVEISPAVVEVAHEWFGISTIPDETLRVHTSCALEWMRCAEQPIDVLLIDLESGASGASGEIRAPPPEVLAPAFLSRIAALVGRHKPGAVAVNTIASESGLGHVASTLSGFFAGGQAMVLHDSEETEEDTEWIHAVVLLGLGGVQVSGVLAEKLAVAMEECGLASQTQSDLRPIL